MMLLLCNVLTMRESRSWRPKNISSLRIGSPLTYGIESAIHGGVRTDTVVEHLIAHIAKTKERHAPQQRKQPDHVAFDISQQRQCQQVRRRHYGKLIVQYLRVVEGLIPGHKLDGHGLRFVECEHQRRLFQFVPRARSLHAREDSQVFPATSADRRPRCQAAMIGPHRSGAAPRRTCRPQRTESSPMADCHPAHSGSDLQARRTNRPRRDHRQWHRWPCSEGHH